MSLLPLGFLQNLGWPELIIILLIVILIFGHRLPSVGRSLGRSLTEFKSGLKEGQEEAEKSAQTKKPDSSDAKEQKVS